MKLFLSFLLFIIFILIMIPYMVYRQFIKNPSIKTYKWFLKELFLERKK